MTDILYETQHAGVYRLKLGETEWVVVNKEGKNSKVYDRVPTTDEVEQFYADLLARGE
jgi:hypothetical protein